MGHNISPHRLRENMLAAPLDMMADRDARLLVACATCQAEREVAFRTILTRGWPPGTTTAELLPRLACRDCRARPVRVVGTDRWGGRATVLVGSGAGW